MDHVLAPPRAHLSLQQLLQQLHRQISLRHPADLGEMLQGHIEEFSDPGDPAALVFPNSEGGIVNGEVFRKSIFQPAAKRAGVNHGLSPNHLRHHAAAFAIRHGANVLHVQRMLGHAKPAITLNVYSYLFEDSLEELAGKLDPVIREARRPLRAVGQR